MKKQNCVIRIQTVSLFTKKTDDIYKDIAEDLKTRLILKIRNQIDHCLKKNNKAIGLVKDELSEKITRTFVGLKA